MEFWFYSIAPRSGIPLNGEFLPNSRPSPFFFFLIGFFFLIVFFLIPIPTGLSHVPINGSGCLYAPILGAPLPPFFLLVPIRGAPLPVLPVKAFRRSGIPMLANRVPKNPPDCVLLVSYKHLNLIEGHSIYPVFVSSIKDACILSAYQFCLVVRENHPTVRLCQRLI